MVLEKLDRDFGVGKKFYVVVELARRDGTGTLFLDLGVAGGAQAEIKISGGQRQFVRGGFEEIVRENGDGGLAFHDSLGCRQFAQEFKLADCDLQSSRRSGLFNRHNRVSRRAALLLLLRYIKLKTYKTSSNSRGLGKVENRAKSHFSIVFQKHPSCPK